MYVSYTELISKEQEKLFPCFPWYGLFNKFEGEREKRRLQKDRRYDGVIVKEERSTTVYCWVKAPGRRGGQETAANCTGWADDCRGERRDTQTHREEQTIRRHRRTNENPRDGRENNVNHWTQLTKNFNYWYITKWQIINMMTNTLMYTV